MPSQKKVQLFKETKEKLDKSKATFFVNYQGLTHKQLEEARSSLKEVDSELSIIKNNLVDLALKDKEIDVKEKLQGPIATLFSYEDPIKTAKALYVFFKKYNLPQIKFGVFGSDVLDETRVIELAKLPSKEIILAQLMGMMKSPMRSLVYSLNWNIQKLALVLKAIEDIKQKS